MRTEKTVLAETLLAVRMRDARKENEAFIFSARFDGGSSPPCPLFILAVGDTRASGRAKPEASSGQTLEL